MIYIALLEGVALAATALSFLALLRSLIRQQARERANLLDRIMHLSGKTWTPPPADTPTVPDDVDGLPTDRFVLSPGALPDNYE
jgi:hypothetical protein